MSAKIKIAVVGMGYVDLSNAILLAQRNTVWAVDIIPERAAETDAGPSRPDDDAIILEFKVFQPRMAFRGRKVLIGEA